MFKVGDIIMLEKGRSDIWEVEVEFKRIYEIYKISEGWALCTACGGYDHRNFPLRTLTHARIRDTKTARIMNPDYVEREGDWLWKK